MRTRLAKISPKALWSLSITTGALVCGLVLVFGKSPARIGETASVAVPAPAVSVSPLIPAQIEIPAAITAAVSENAASASESMTVDAPKLRGVEKKFKPPAVAFKKRRSYKKAMKPVAATVVVAPEVKAPLLAANSKVDTYSDVVAAFETLAPSYLAKNSHAAKPALAINKLIDSGLEEGSLSVSVDLDWKQSAAQVDKVALLEKKPEQIPELPLEPKNSFVVSELVKEDFSDIHERLARIKDLVPSALDASLAQPKAKPEMELFRPKAKKAVKVAKAEPVSPREEGAAETARLQEPAQDQPQALEEDLQPVPAAPVSASAPQTRVLDAREELATMEMAPAASEPFPTVALPPTHGVVTPRALTATPTAVPSQLPTARVSTPVAQERQASNETSVPTQRELMAAVSPAVTTREASSIRSRIDGVLEMSRELETFLNKKRWHLELHLEPVDQVDRTSADTEALNFRYPTEEFGDEFSIESFQLDRAKRLVARIYEKGNVEPASIPFREILQPGYKRRVRFKLTKKDYEYYTQYQQNVPTGDVLITASVFEGASGDHRNPNKIPGAKVEVVKNEKLGVFVAGSDATVRVPGIQVRGEVILKVSADGYYDTYHTVPVFNRDVYTVVYLVSRDKVDAITRHFTQNAQQDGKAILMGRVFDAETRVPKVGETLNLLFRKGRALYIDSLPDVWLRATTSTGLFGFFNVVGSMRAVLRGDSLIPLLVNLRPNTATYIEPGRFGKKQLRARLVDRFNQDLPSARVRLVGQSQSVAESDEEGRFTIPGIDLPAGTITLEIEASGYNTTWFTIPWDPARRSEEYSLFLLNEDIVNENIKVSAKQSAKKGMGQLFGGAEPSLFHGHKGCLTVTLESTGTKKLVPTQGPFGWSPEGRELSAQCLDEKNPRFQFANLEPDEYILKWVEPNGKVFRNRIVHIGADRTSIVIN